MIIISSKITKKNILRNISHFTYLTFKDISLNLMVVHFCSMGSCVNGVYPNMYSVTDITVDLSSFFYDLFVPVSPIRFLS